MKLAWLTKLPTMGVPMRGEGASTLLTDVFPKTAFSHPEAAVVANPGGSDGKLNRLWDGLRNRMAALMPQNLFKGNAASAMSVRNLFVMSEQNQKLWKEQVETYAESPFEKALFSTQRRPNEFNVSRAWAIGIKSPDPLTRESALALLKSYFTYIGMESTEQLSAHTQMKFLIFSPHLTEGAMGRVVLYEAVLGLPLAQMLEFATILKQDFQQLPPIAQALILKQILGRWKARDKQGNAEDTAALKKLLKALVIQFYTSKHETLDQVLGKQEKIRLGFLKIQPVEEDYRKQLEELERRYRLKLRQLKKRRQMKVAEVEEEKLRRLEMIYDSVEGNLMSGLNDLELNLEEVLVV
jgi:hypothetical protein